MNAITLPEMPPVWNWTEVEDYLRQSGLHSRHAPREVYDRMRELEERFASELVTEPFLHALIMTVVVESSDYLGMDAEMTRAAEQANALLPDIQVPKQRAHIVNCLGVYYHYSGRLADAHRCYQEALDLSVLDGITGRIIANTRAVGSIAQTVGEYDRALDCYLRALEMVDETTHHHVVVALYYSLGQTYAMIGDAGQALHYYKQTLVVARQHQERIFEADALSGIADLYLKDSKIHEAVGLLSTASGIWHRLGNGFHYLKTLLTLVDAHLLLGNPDLADEAARAALELSRAGSDPVPVARVLLSVAAVLDHRGDLHSAYAQAADALEIALSSNREPLERDVREVLADLCARLGEFEESCAHRVRWGELLLKLIGEERQKELANVEVRYAIEIDRREREMLQLRAERAEQMIDLQTKELSATALALTKRNEVLQNLRAVVQPLAHTERGRARTVASVVLERIEEVIASRDEWGVFEEQFERVHHDFIVRLRERCASLTPTEIRVCVLLRLNLPTKQIADILCSAPDTVKVHRKHIRKKLDVDADDNLTSLLLAL